MDAKNPHAENQFKLKKVVTLGDLLTPLSVLASLLALWLTWSHDNDLKQRQYADQIKHSASVVTAKIERWSTLSDRYFDDIQPTLVDVSEMIEKTHQRQPANRRLYKGLIEAAGKSSQRIVDEQLEVAYIDLYGYVPSLQETFDKTIQQLKAIERNCHDETSDTLQAKLQDPNFLRLTSSVLIGNDLRIAANEKREQLRREIERVAAPLRQKMLNLIHLPDAKIIDKPSLDAAMQSADASKQ